MLPNLVLFQNMQVSMFTGKGTVSSGDAGKDGEVEDIDVDYLCGLRLPCPLFTLNAVRNKFEKVLLNVWSYAITLQNYLISLILPTRGYKSM